MKINDTISGLGKVLGAIAPVFTKFYPNISAPVVLAGEALQNLAKVDENRTNGVVFGISATSLYVDEILADYNKSRVLDVEKLQLVADNLKRIDVSVDTFHSLIS